MYVVVELNHVAHQPVYAFILGLLALVIVLYLLVRLIAGILHAPGRMQRFGVARQGRQAWCGAQ